MSIIRALPKDLTLIHRLIQQGRHVYTNFGQVDLSHFLREGIALLGIDEGAAWGFLCIEQEARPATLPPPMLSRAYLRSVALARGASPAIDVNQLLNAALPSMADTLPTQLIYYATQSWLVRPLEMAGFQIAERVEYLRLDYLNRRAEIQISPPKAEAFPAEIVLRPFLPTDAAQLAQLDIETFNPLWHMDATQLQELALYGRVQVATLSSAATPQQISTPPEGEVNHLGALLGYSALVLSSSGEAQLARLAVHPKAQGYGLGRTLLGDVIQYAQSHGASTVVLNTQTTNQASLALYQSVGFRSSGQITPVLTKAFR